MSERPKCAQHQSAKVTTARTIGGKNIYICLHCGANLGPSPEDSEIRDSMDIAPPSLQENDKGRRTE